MFFSIMHLTIFCYRTVKFLENSFPDLSFVIFMFINIFNGTVRQIREYLQEFSELLKLIRATAYFLQECHVRLTLLLTLPYYRFNEKDLSFNNSVGS